MVFSFFIGKEMQENGILNLRNIFFTISTILFVASFALVPAIWDRTLKVLLPLKSEFAHLVSKDINVLETCQSNGSTTTTKKYFLTFEFTDGHRKTFCVNPSSSRYDIFFAVLLHESGKLCYKEQGKHLYFVSFTPDSTGQTIEG